MAMRWLRWLGIALLAVGIGLIAASVATGEGQLILIVFIPAFIGSGPIGILGILAVFAGLFLAMASVMWGPAALHGGPEERPIAGPSPPPTIPTPAAAKRFGGVVMIGPVPIVFGSDQRIVTWMIVLGFVLLGLTLIAWLLFIRGFP